MVHTGKLMKLLKDGILKQSSIMRDRKAWITFPYILFNVPVKI